MGKQAPIYTDIEETAKVCKTCQMSHHAPAKAKVHPWEWTTKRWSRLHIDFAGPFQGKVFLVVVDAHSKWLEVSLMSFMSSSAVINTLRLLFAIFGFWVGFLGYPMSLFQTMVLLSHPQSSKGLQTAMEFVTSLQHHITQARMVKLNAWYRQQRRPCLFLLKVNGRPNLLVFCCHSTLHPIHQLEKVLLSCS